MRPQAPEPSSVSILELSSSDLTLGLPEDEAKKRLQDFGPNILEEGKKESVLHKILEELVEPMILLLLVVGILYSVWGEPEDAVTIFLVILALIGVEVFNELRAEKTIEALNLLSEQTSPVIRNGERKEMPTRDLVPGDVILLEPGRRVPADAVLRESYGLAADESALTGESVAAEKLPSDKAENIDRESKVFAGTVITRGRGKGIVIETGMRTELARTVSLARGVKPPKTPLQKTMNELTRWMVFLALGFSILIPLLGWLVNGQNPETMVLTALSLAFATIPEELPIIITMVLALGGYRLSKQHAIVKRLQAVETLGSVTVIVTDKTGTLTSNRMEVSDIWPVESKIRILTLGALCNDAYETTTGIEGDPLDTALLRSAAASGIDVKSLRLETKLVEEFSFDNVRKMMSVVVRSSDGETVIAKGSPEQILARSSRVGEELIEEDDIIRIKQEASRMAAEGLRVLAFGEKRVANHDQMTAESDLSFVGLVGLSDPPRSEVKGAVSECGNAGIRVLMVTGDHPLTALSVAKQVGIDGGEVITGTELDDLTDEQLSSELKRASVFARTTPSHKLRIVQSLQKSKERVAVTGDGINDAPALAAADIGVAMGEGGTDVAREAADMVLADNNFATISHAVREGRRLFANLKKGVRYYLACKVALVSTALIAVLLGTPIPFSPLQIILLELFMDLGASAAFVSEKEESDIMNRPPQDSHAPFLDRGMIRSIFASASGLFLAVSIAYLATWYSTQDIFQSQTAAFVTWLLGHVLLAFNMRSDREPLLKLGLLSNKVMVAWGMAAAAFAVLVTLLPEAHSAFKTASLSESTWIMIIILSLAGSFWIEVYKWVVFERRTMGGQKVKLPD